jgi:hypothetical protein
VIMGASDSRAGGCRPSSCSTDSRKAVAGAEDGVEDPSDGIGRKYLVEEDIISSVMRMKLWWREKGRI